MRSMSFTPVPIIGDTPLFTIVSAPSSITGRPGQTVTVSVTVRNDSTAPGTVTVRIIDHNENIAGSQGAYLYPGESITLNIDVTLPSTGSYLWRIEAFNEDTQFVDDQKTLTVYVYAKRSTSITLTISPL